MQRAMLFLDFENFDIAYKNYYNTMGRAYPRLDYNELPRRVVDMLPTAHVLVKTFLFAPKPDEFLMQDIKWYNKYKWIDGLKNQKYFTVVESEHRARPNFYERPMDIADPDSYHIVEKGTDIHLTAHLITKGFMNAYDTAVIMSGDTDYIPVLDILNTLGRSTVIVGVEGQNLHKFVHHSDDQMLLDDNVFQMCLRP